MNEDKLVYIVLINYNAVKHTRECVESLLRVDYRNFRILIVDNNSKDPVDELLGIDKDIVIIKNKTNLGFAGGNNVGIKYALDHGADFVLLLNNDTVVDSHFLTIMMNQALANHAAIVCPKILNYYERNKVMYAGGDISQFKGGVTIEGAGKVDSKKWDKTRKITFAHGCCMLIDKTVFGQAGFLPEEFFLYYEDTAFSAILNHKGLNLIYTGNAVIYHKESVSVKKGSSDFQYYFVRNRLLFVAKYIDKQYKIFAWIYSWAFICKGIFIRNFEIANCIQAVRDYKYHNFGERRNPEKDFKTFG